MCTDTRHQTPPHRSLSLAWLARTHIQRSSMNRRRGEVKGRRHGLGQGGGQEQKAWRGFFSFPSLSKHSTPCSQPPLGCPTQWL